MTPSDARKIVAKRLRRRASEYLEDLLENHSVASDGIPNLAYTILLAYLMTCIDGYNQVELYYGNWAQRPKSQFQTTLGYLVPLGNVVADFVFDCRCGEHSRELAILIDSNAPNIRTVQKQREERALTAVCSSVMVFTSEEIFADPDGCTESEGMLVQLMEHAMTDAGVKT